MWPHQVGTLGQLTGQLTTQLTGHHRWASESVLSNCLALPKDVLIHVPASLLTVSSWTRILPPRGQGPICPLQSAQSRVHSLTVSLTVSPSTNCWVDGSQSGICKQLVLSVNAGSATPNHGTRRVTGPQSLAFRAARPRKLSRTEQGGGCPRTWGVERGRVGLAPEARPTGAML